MLSLLHFEGKQFSVDLVVFFQNEEIFVQLDLDELDDWDRMTHA